MAFEPNLAFDRAGGVACGWAFDLIWVFTVVALRRIFVVFGAALTTTVFGFRRSPMFFMMRSVEADDGPHQTSMRLPMNVNHVPGWPQHLPLRQE